MTGKTEKVYPEQSEWVKGKIWLELPNSQRICVSPQARNVLKFYNVDEERFIQKMRELLKECFSNLKQEKGYDFSFRDLFVSKASDPWLSDEESEVPSIRIELRECTGKKEADF